MLQDVMDELEMHYEKVLQDLSRDLSKIRTGRATTAMLDGITIEYYGSPTPITQVASCRIADPRMITIQPWEAKLIPQIEKAIGQSDLGLNPMNDGVLIRLPIPALTGERRQELVKICKRAGEDHKIAMRNHRRDANDMVKALEKDSQITEDEMHKSFEKINGLTETYTKKIDGMLDKKESEIMEV